MHIRVGYACIDHCPQPTPMLLTVHIHFTRVSDLIVPDHLSPTPSLPITASRDTCGHWCSRSVAPQGQRRRGALQSLTHQSQRPFLDLALALLALRDGVCGRSRPTGAPAGGAHLYVNSIPGTRLAAMPTA